MLAPTKGLLNLSTSFLTSRMIRKLQDTRRAVPEQQKTFARLRDQLARTAYGRDVGIAAGAPYRDFQARVPLRSYADLAPYIDRMRRGEENVLWPGRCSFYATTSGTTDGGAKFLPVTEAMVGHFRRAGLDALLHYTARVGHTGVFNGRHLFLGGSTLLSRLDESKLPAYSGEISGIAALNLPRWAEKHLYEPGPEIARLADWPAKIRAIAERTWNRDVSLLAGIPGWMLVLAEAVIERTSRGKARPTHLQAVWPNLECLIHGGVPVGPFVDELHSRLGPRVNFHEVYPASEGFIATQDAESTLGLRLMTDTGLFFEFLPMTDYRAAVRPGKLGATHGLENLNGLGAKTVPLEGVRAGVDYALVLTTPAGLARCVVGDIVRFTTTDIPRLFYAGRTALQLGAFGESVVEKELTDSLLTVCHRHNWTITSFHVAPQFTDSATGRKCSRHEWWVELRPRSVKTPTGPVLAGELDAELQRLSADYAARRQSGQLDHPNVRLVMPGVFEHWMREKGKWGGHNKMPRCRSDREIADELAQIARFSFEA